MSSTHVDTDFMRRVAEALTRTDDAEQVSNLPVGEHESPLGVLPGELHHLYVLARTYSLMAEQFEGEKRVRCLERTGAIGGLLSVLAGPALPEAPRYAEIAMRTGWVLVGVRLKKSVESTGVEGSAQNAHSDEVRRVLH